VLGAEPAAHLARITEGSGERHAPVNRAMGAAGEAVSAKPLGAGRGKHREGRGVGDKAALFFPKLQGDGTGNARGLARHLPRVGASAAGEAGSRWRDERSN